LTAMRVADAQVEPARRSDVARREDSHTREVAGRLRAACKEISLGIAEARDPVRAAQSGEVRVAVDESWDDGRARRVDDPSAGRIGSEPGSLFGSWLGAPAGYFCLYSKVPNWLRRTL